MFNISRFVKAQEDYYATKSNEDLLDIGKDYSILLAKIPKINNYIHVELRLGWVLLELVKRNVLVPDENNCVEI